MKYVFEKKLNKIIIWWILWTAIVWAWWLFMSWKPKWFWAKLKSNFKSFNTFFWRWYKELLNKLRLKRK